MSVYQLLVLLSLTVVCLSQYNYKVGLSFLTSQNKSDHFSVQSSSGAITIALKECKERDLLRNINIR